MGGVRRRNGEQAGHEDKPPDMPPRDPLRGRANSLKKAIWETSDVVLSLRKFACLDMTTQSPRRTPLGFCVRLTRPTPPATSKAHLSCRGHKRH